MLSEVDINPLELHQLIKLFLHNKQYGIDRVVITQRSVNPRVVTTSLLDSRGECIAENEISDLDSW